MLGLSIELPYWDLYLFLEVTPSVNRWTECNQLAQHFSPHPMEQDALFAPNHSGNLPTSHLNLVRAWRKRSLRTFMDVLQATAQASVHHIFFIFRPTSDHFYGGKMVYKTQNMFDLLHWNSSAFGLLDESNLVHRISWHFLVRGRYCMCKYAAGIDSDGLWGWKFMWCNLKLGS